MNDKAKVIILEREKNKFIAALLAIFLGLFGIQQFYLGNTLRGIIYIILTICTLSVVSGIIAIIEFVYYLVCSQDSFDAKYNKGYYAQKLKYGA